MKTKILTTFTIVAAACIGSAQSLQDEKNIFRIDLGVMQLRTQDNQYSPRVYKALCPSLGVTYAREKKKGIFDASIHMKMGSLVPQDGSLKPVYITDTDFDGNDGLEIQELAYTQMSVSLEAGYLHHIATGGKARWFAGGSLVENLTYTPSTIYIGTINYASLNLRGRMDYPFENGKVLSVGLAFPILSVVTRMPYHNSPVFPGKSSLEAFFTDNNELATLNTFQNETFFVRYQWYKGKKMSMDVQFESMFRFYKKPERLVASGQQISLGINL